MLGTTRVREFFQLYIFWTIKAVMYFQWKFSFVIETCFKDFEDLGDVFGKRNVEDLNNFFYMECIMLQWCYFGYIEFNLYMLWKLTSQVSLYVENCM